jgi:hypothetical protein
MKNLLGALLLACLLLQAGCITPQRHTGPMVSVIDTIEGREHVVSAKIAEDGKFKTAKQTNGRMQFLSGQVTKSGDNYVVTVKYGHPPIRPDGTTAIHTRIETTVTLQEGESQAIGGVGNDVVYVRISN